MFESIASTLLEFTSSWGYFGIFFLMAVESSFVPFPSEIVVPPAAYLAYQGEMNIFLVVFCGILGSLTGAMINYGIARGLGRPVVYSIAQRRIFRYLLITKHKIVKSEDYFLKYGNISTFLGRLVPGVRQLISLPAGFSKMKVRNFVFYTFLGSGLWVSILAVLGYFFGAKQDVLEEYYFEISLFFIFVAILVIGILIFRSKRLGLADRLKRIFRK